MVLRVFDADPHFVALALLSPYLRNDQLVLLKDDTELFEQFSDNTGFKRSLADTVFGRTYQDAAARDHSVGSSRSAVMTWRRRGA